MPSNEPSAVALFKNLGRSPSSRQYKSDFLKAYNEGIKEGHEQLRVQVLSWLEAEFMKREVTRGSERGEAILELARELSNHTKELKEKYAPVKS